ncbi:PREDICTED: MICOS complex subunit Mic10 [Tarenaya hassleriana]|uniref:MICOS complex subunit Mic10 n=1 Tax=Tarenaya hassleriana TaxID=28532 RepID=UPI00053C92C0|nr:PREDICTED: MICOS complex subunit Mic10 [Tarenaya hassleriana]
MAENKEIVPQKYDVNAKWDACLDLTVRRFVYSSLGGAFAGLLFFRSPVTRWASLAFGAGLGIGSAYADCGRAFDAPSSSSSAAFSAPNTTEVSEPQAVHE